MWLAKSTNETIEKMQKRLVNSCKSFKKSDNIWEKNIHREKFDPYGNILALWNFHLVSHYRNWYMHSKPKITFPRLNDGWPIGHAILLITLASLVIYLLVTLLMTVVFLSLNCNSIAWCKQIYVKALPYQTIAIPYHTKPNNAGETTCLGVAFLSATLGLLCFTTWVTACHVGVGLLAPSKNILWWDLSRSCSPHSKLRNLSNSFFNSTLLFSPHKLSLTHQHGGYK